jgi:transposase
MPAKRVVCLSAEQRRRCERVVKSGTAHARSILHAHVLLKTDSGPDGPSWTNQAVSDAFDVSTVTVSHLRRLMVEQGLDAALSHYQAPRREYRRKLDGHQEAHLLAIARSDPPEGAARWSLRLIRDRMVELGYVDEISHETVRVTLKKGPCSLGATCNGASRRPKTRSS